MFDIVLLALSPQREPSTIIITSTIIDLAYAYINSVNDAQQQLYSIYRGRLCFENLN